MKKLSVTLKLFYGAVNYDAYGNVTSKSENIKLQHGTPEWANYLKHLRANGISKAEVVNVYDLSSFNKEVPVESLDRYKEVDDVEAIQNEVDKYIKIPEAELTPEQKELKELREKLEALTSGTQFQVLKKSTTSSDDAAKELKEARDEYEKIVGKKGGPTWTAEQIKNKIAEFQALNALEDARAKYLEVVGEPADEALTVEELEVKIKEKES